MGSVSLPTFVAPNFGNVASFAEAAASGAFDKTQLGWASSVFERKGLGDLAKLLNGVRDRRAIERFVLRHEREVREALASAPWGAYRMKIDRHKPARFGSLDVSVVAALLVLPKARQEVQLTTGGLTASPVRSVSRNGSGPHPPPHFATEADSKVLKMALILYQKWNGALSKSPVVHGSLNGTHLEGEISLSKVGILLSGKIGVSHWQQLWKGFAIYFSLVASEEGPKKQRAARMASELLDHFFQKRGWKTKPRTARERLRHHAQRFVALRFAGNIPGVGAIFPGVPNQKSSGRVMTRWLAGEDLSLNKRLRPAEFYGQVVDLLLGLGRKEEEINPLIRDAVFEERGWKQNGQTAHDRLLLAVREVMAILHGGWSDDFPLPSMRWVETGEFFLGLNVPAFYSWVRHALREGGVSEEKAEALVLDFYFEKRGWQKRERTPQDRLLFQARRVFALHYHGVFPALGDDDRSFLNLWLNGKISNITEPFLSIVTRFLLESRAITRDETNRLVTEIRK